MAFDGCSRDGTSSGFGPRRVATIRRSNCTSGRIERSLTPATCASRRLPVKVLHIVESLDRGAVENWLVRTLRHAQRRGVPLDWTFFCILVRPGMLDDEAESLGARVIHSPVPLGQ